jgi:chemotaxis protein methyltransferase CheR
MNSNKSLQTSDGTENYGGNYLSTEVQGLHKQDAEVTLFLESVFQKFGYDFRNYSRSHLLRRIYFRMQREGISSVNGLREKILSSPDAFNVLLQDFSINVTEMFRDPHFFHAFRQKVVPILSTYPYIKVWNAGCSTGEEVYSLAIVLKEENLLNRTQIYATDFNKNVLEVARKGIFPLEYIEGFNKNYKEAGGKYDLSDYYTSKYGSVKFDSSLTKKIVFADHNLVIDQVFAEVHLIFCRNVLIYFNTSLQQRVIGLFYNSLINGGVLCLGTKETIRHTEKELNFSTVDRQNRIFKKKQNIIV